MSNSSLASLMDVELQPGKPPVVRAETGAPDGSSAANWPPGTATRCVPWSPSTAAS